MRARRLFLGMLAGNAGGGLLCGLTALLMPLVAKNNAGIPPAIFYPSFFSTPFFIGLIAAWVWRPLKLSVGVTALHSLTTTLVGLLASAVVQKEGAVCLVMVSPLIYVMIFAGALCGRIWFRVDRDKLNLSMFPLLALVIAAEPQWRSDREAVVADEILIHAPPAKVWPHILAFPEIAEPPRYWLFRLGLPYPMQTTNGGNFAGALRKCIFSNGVTLPERVVEFVPEARLTFDITEQPADPEAYGHVTLHRGRFELRDNHDGTTTLTGSSWYSLHVRPRWYFALWMESATRAVHRRVMEHIRRLAESEA